MTFDEAVDAVLLKIDRPDKSEEAVLAVNQAIHFCTIEGNFFRDLIEVASVTHTSNEENTVHNIALADLPLFRKVVYLKPANEGRSLDHLDPSAITNKNNMSRCNVYYLNGSTILAKTKHAVTEFDIGYMAYPAVLASGDSHWMLDVSPYMIINYAAYVVYTQVGNTKEADRHFSLFLTTMEAAKRDYQYGATYG